MSFGMAKLGWCAYCLYLMVKNFDVTIMRFDRIHERDRQTDSQGRELTYLVPLETEAKASIEHWRDLEIWVRGRSRPRRPKMVPIDRSRMTLYWYADFPVI